MEAMALAYRGVEGMPRALGMVWCKCAVTVAQRIFLNKRITPVLMAVLWGRVLACHLEDWQGCWRMKE